MTPVLAGLVGALLAAVAVAAALVLARLLPVLLLRRRSIDR